MQGGSKRGCIVCVGVWWHAEQVHVGADRPGSVISHATTCGLDLFRPGLTALGTQPPAKPPRPPAERAAQWATTLKLRAGVMGVVGGGGWW